MLALLHPMAVGNAVRIILSPPVGAETWTLLRKPTDDISHADDPGATLIRFHVRDTAILDRNGVRNGVPCFYRPFYYDAAGQEMPAVPSGGVTPEARFVDAGADPLEVVRERVALGLEVELAAGRLHHTQGVIPLLAAPFARPDEVTFPCVSVHLDEGVPEARALGEMTGADEVGDILTDEFEGELTRFQIGVTGVALAGPDRSDLRRALKRIILANASIFATEGMAQVTFSQTDTEILAPQNGPTLFITNGRLTCIAPTAVALPVRRVEDVTATALESA